MPQFSSLLLGKDEKLNRRALQICLWLSAACGLAGIVLILSLPGDPKNAVLFGFSAARGLMLAGMAILTVLPLAAARMLKRIYRSIGAILENARRTTPMIMLAAAILLLGIWFITYAQAHASDRYITAYLARLTPFVGWFCLAALETLALLPLFQPRLRLPTLMLSLSVLLTAILAAFTNHYAVSQMPWDVKYFYLLAERGFGGQNISPYVYRFGNPFLARAIADSFSLPVYAGYVVVSWLGGILQLFSIYLLVSHLTLQGRTEENQPETSPADLFFILKTSALAMLVVTFTTFNLKYLLFDVSRPDQLAYGLMGLAVLALLQDRYVVCALLGAVGLQFREYLALPPFILALGYAKDWFNSRTNLRPLLRIGFLALVSGLAVLLPRLLIPVSEQTQFVDPQNPATLRNLIDMPLNLNRDINYLFSVAVYFLPLWLLITPARLKNLLRDLRPYRLLLGAYIVIVLILTLYGGHDMPRYISYMSIPLVFALFSLSRQKIPAWEWLFMLAAVAVFNRSFGWIPGWDMEAFLDYYGGYGERIDLSSWLRWLEFAGWLAGGALLKIIAGTFQKEKQN